ncbi:hypothetical protein PQU92_06730 [Asticcacaulis sp. BYS171W]|uniref:Thioredoxin-like fold domain-containing protein n=1 Tax=Asticcacaulis aquaticus TaxID=2984212 RepID=A0ABT5HSB4_9CAUL|nr:hypothetical protein [Asticcacaulis aquaticus]MDC7682963.1 hypothetical protein [Asticcacaulis aquaticus]
MTKKHILYAIFVLLTVTVLGGVGYWAYWNFFIRWSPITVTQNQKEIQTLLDASGFAASGKEGPEMWVITYRNCASCKVWEEQELPKFEAIAADIRIVPFAPMDVEGKTKTTPSERATIAEIWLNRSYSLYRQWRAAPEETWQPDFRAADGDLARTAVVGASRDFITQLEPLLANNGVPIRYPLIIWRDGAEHIKICACSDERMYHYVRDDLHAPASLTEKPAAPAAPMIEQKQPQPLPEAGTVASEAAASNYGPDAL